MPLSPGTTLGPYAVTAKIGAGGMGEMYRARDTFEDFSIVSVHRSCRFDVELGIAGAQSCVNLVAK